MKKNHGRLTLLSSHLIGLICVNEPIPQKRNGTIMSNTDDTQSSIDESMLGTNYKAINTEHTNN